MTTGDPRSDAYFSHVEHCPDCIERGQASCDEALALRQAAWGIKWLSDDFAVIPAPPPYLATSYATERQPSSGGRIVSASAAAKPVKQARSCTSGCQRSKQPKSKCRCACHGQTHGRTA